MLGRIIKNQSLSRKFLLGLGTISTLLVLLVVYSLVTIFMIKGNVTKLKELTQQVESAGRIREEIITIYPNLLLMSYWNDEESVEGLVKRIDELHGLYTQKMQKMDSFARKMGDSRLLSLIGELKNRSEEALKEDKRFIEYIRARKIDFAMDYYMGPVVEKRTLLKKTMDEMLNYINKQYEDYSNKILAQMKWQAIILITFSLFLIIFFAYTSYIMIKTIRDPIVSTAKAMEELASGEGDLTFRLQVESTDEIGKLSQFFNQFMESLREMVKRFVEEVKILFAEADDLQREVAQLEEASFEFKERADFIVLSSTEILSSMEEISQSLQELTSAVNEISQRAQDSSSIVKQTVLTVDNTKSKVEYLKVASIEINEVVNLIDNIAEQTNLLALNASIEAARAGEAGKGFAVVANEVKELARQTQEATKVIAEKISLLQDSSSEVSTGVEEIVNLIKTVEDASTAIASAVEEQTIVVSTVSEHIFGVKDKVMLNEEQAKGIKNSVDVLVNLSMKLKEVSAKVKGVAEEIKEVTSHFRI